MEKRIPHCKLTVALRLISEEKYRITKSAIEGGAALELDADGIVEVVCALPERGKFYKSMTTHADHKVWQDVYHTTTPAGDKDVYLKLTVTDDVLIVSFKEKES
jgi:motility quorum-sensing regulator/GCU-specific mRNA interferase toxin